MLFVCHPKIFTKALFSVSLGAILTPKKNWRQCSCKFWGVRNKEHYGVLWYFLEWSMATRSLFKCITSDCLPVLLALYDSCQTFCGAPRKPHPPHLASHPCLWSCDWYSHWLAPCFEHRSGMKLNEQNVLLFVKVHKKVLHHWQFTNCELQSNFSLRTPV